MRELTVQAGDVLLAGAVWLPQRDAVATLLMHPGSGPSDRDNDVYFPPIREHLLAAGIAVSSFDKRGVGGSTGQWQDAGIVEQADDLLACLAALLGDDAVPKPIGLFGHSQGGWVVLDAAGRRPPIAFVVTNSGPGVTPAEQERYSHRSYLLAHGVPRGELVEAQEPFDRLLEALRMGASFSEVREQLEPERLPAVYRRLDLILLPDDEELWSSFLRIFDYDPRWALERVSVPLLALFGEDDPIVPVAESVSAYEETVRPELLTVAILPGANHRAQAGDPPELVAGYLETLSSFVRRVSAASSSSSGRPARARGA